MHRTHVSEHKKNLLYGNYPYKRQDVPDRSRTCGLQSRSLTLYPTELLVRGEVYYTNFSSNVNRLLYVSIIVCQILPVIAEVIQCSLHVIILYCIQIIL